MVDVRRSRPGNAWPTFSPAPVTVDASDILDRFDALDRALVARGFPATSPWWREQIERFYRSGRRQLVLRVGRRGGKSSTLCRLACIEALYGQHAIPPGDAGIVGIVSVSREEASSRLRTIRAILDALGQKYKEDKNAGSIELVGRAVIFKVFTASVAGVVGGTWICAICDELAIWRDADSGANPASLVLASLRPTLATQPNAKLFLSSSPLGNEDAHAKAFDEGDNDRQLVAHAPTWIANPTLSEAWCRSDEPDDRNFQRQYAAIPSVAVSAAFDPDAVAMAFVPRGGRLERVAAPIICTDPAGRGSDNWGVLAAGWVEREPSDLERFEVVEGSVTMNGQCYTLRRDLAGRPIPRGDYLPPPRVLLVEHLHVISASYRARTSAEDVYRTIGDIGRRVDARICATDQFDSYSGASWLKKEGMEARSFPWTATSKAKAVTRLRSYLHAESIAVAQEPLADQLRRELLAFEERVGANGITYAGRDASGGHLDLVSCLLTGMMADDDGALEGAPANGRISNALFAFGSDGFRSTF